MILRPFLYDETACTSYLFGCLTHRQLAVVDPHEALVERYLAAAERAGAPIVAVFETHVQADHVSGLPDLVASTGATAYLPEGAGVDFPHAALGDGQEVELGNTVVRAIATQLGLLVGLNALVGALVGLERSVLAPLGERSFGVASKSAVLSFIV